MHDPDHGGARPIRRSVCFVRPVPQGIGDNPPVVVRNNFHRPLIHQLNVQTENESGFQPVVERFNGQCVAARRQQPGHVVFRNGPPVASASNLPAIQEEPVTVVHRNAQRRMGNRRVRRDGERSPKPARLFIRGFGFPNPDSEMIGRFGNQSRGGVGGRVSGPDGIGKEQGKPQDDCQPRESPPGRKIETRFRFKSRHLAVNGTL